MIGATIIYQFDNDFGTFTVEELNYEGRPARVLFSGPNHAAQSGIPLDNNPRLLFDYNQRLLELALDLKPRKILILGGGTFTLATALATALPKSKLTVVERNKDLVKIAESYFGYLPNSRLRLVINDAAIFMDQRKPLYDLIYVDIYDNFIIPDQFRGVEFAKKLNKALLTNGMVAVNCISGLHGAASLPMRQIAGAFSEVIGPVKVIQADQNYSHYLPQNLIVMTRKNQPINKTWLKGYLEINDFALPREDLLK